MVTSDDAVGKSPALLEAAIRIIAAQGTGASTASIAREAGVAAGTLFNHFNTKDELLNRLYVALKTEMGASALAGVVSGADLRQRFGQLWAGWLHWAACAPERRRTLALLEPAPVITPASRAEGQRALAGIAAVIEEVRVTGAMRDAPPMLIVTLLGAVADAAADHMAANPADLDRHGKTAIEAAWRMLA